MIQNVITVFLALMIIIKVSVMVIMIQVMNDIMFFSLKLF